MSSSRRTDDATSGSCKTAKIGRAFTVQKNPSFISTRNDYFSKLYQIQCDKLKDVEQKAIKIVLPDGKEKDGFSSMTTPMDIATAISIKLAQDVVVAEVTYIEAVEEVKVTCADSENDPCCSNSYKSQLWDMTRPLIGSCKIVFLKFDDPKAQNVFWHSSAHILGLTLESIYGAQLTIGPALTLGFYYDCYMGEHAISQADYDGIQKAAMTACQGKLTFERLLMTKEEALKMFEDNPFKTELINSKIADNSFASCYRCGNFVDLCSGPHIPSTKHIKAFEVTKHSSAYWLGQSDLDSLQRTYGIAYPSVKQLEQYKRVIEESKKRDHRVLGSSLDLFFFDPSVSAGSCFWLPEGTKIYNKLVDFLRTEYRIRGFTEVISPNIYSCDLWKTSGHYQNYKENMYLFEIEGKEWGLKPMNCPGHCCMFKHINPSYRQLPIRMADFGVLHRNELSGSLTGLTRVRRFQQDDAHIFCTQNQLEGEVNDALNFLFFVYDKFGFEYDLQLSTKPVKALGTQEQWDVAEKALTDALNATGKSWTLNPADGAFYGPKIDIKLYDALRRPHQCGTIQLDFQLPIRFNLQYRTQDEVVAESVETKKANEDGEDQVRPGCARPIMIHRAILGSLERMIAVLIEHNTGKLPFWMSPRQAIVLPISEKHDEYGKWVERTLHNFGYDTGIDLSNNTINKKVRDAQLSRWNYMLIVGEAESNAATVTVRSREDPKNQRVVSVDEIIKIFEAERLTHSEKLCQFVPWK